MRAFLVSTALSGLAASAFAVDAASAPAAAAPAASASVQIVAAAPAQPKLVCHRETPIGSTIPQKVCHTESPGDAAATAEMQAELATEAQRNRMITVHAAGG